MRKEGEASSVFVEAASVAAPTSSLSPLEYSSRPIMHRPAFTTHKDLVIATSRPGSPVPQPDSGCATPLREAVEKHGSLASTPILGGRMSLCVHCQHYDRHRKGSDDTDECDEEHSRVWRIANTSPVPPTMSSPSTNGSSEDDQGVGGPVDTPELAVTPTHATDNEVKAKRLPLPSAELTYAALDLALQLPGTEWISSFWSFS